MEPEIYVTKEGKLLIKYYKEGKEYYLIGDAAKKYIKKNYANKTEDSYKKGNSNLHKSSKIKKYKELIDAFRPCIDKTNIDKETKRIVLYKRYKNNK